MSVLDASVVLKWFVTEEDSAEAIKLRHQFVIGERSIIVPDLLLYECANALKYHPDFSGEEIQKSVESLFQLGIDIITPTASLLKKAIDISISNDVTIYDATYLALAEEIQDDLITADDKFYRKVHKKFSESMILLPQNQ